MNEASAPMGENCLASQGNLTMWSYLLNFIWTHKSCRYAVEGTLAGLNDPDIIMFSERNSEGFADPNSGFYHIPQDDYATGAARYVGAATLGDTPKDARVSLELTNAFDVYAHARQVSAQRVDKRHTRRTIEVTVFNEKAKPTEVRLVEGLGSAWRVESETVKGRKLNASTDQWTLSVPSGGKTTLRYTVLLGG